MLLNRIHSSFALNQVPFRSNNSPISANHVCPECNHSYNLERQPNVDSFEKINSDSQKDNT